MGVAEGQSSESYGPGGDGGCWAKTESGREKEGAAMHSTTLSGTFNGIEHGKCRFEKLLLGVECV
jgi:hypothetical protein